MLERERERIFWFDVLVLFVVVPISLVVAILFVASFASAVALFAPTFASLATLSFAAGPRVASGALRFASDGRSVGAGDHSVGLGDHQVAVAYHLAQQHDEIGEDLFDLLQGELIVAEFVEVNTRR